MRIGSSRRYEFEYVVTNGSLARDRIGTWLLIIPAAADSPVITSPNNWAGTTTRPPIFRQVELPDQPRGRIAVWLRQGGEARIGPGDSKRGFRLESGCTPGFTTALFGSAQGVYFDQDLPEVVFKQSEFFNDPAWLYVPALTFGPMFCSGTTSQQIIQNMRSGMRCAIATNLVSARSEFVRDAVSALEALAAGNAAPAVLAHAPASEFEQEISQALQLSLSFRVGTRE
jgi:hypothetical protein